MKWEQFLIRLTWALPLLYLNLAALHDIARGEPSLWMEWSVIALTTAGAILFVGRKCFRRPAHS